MVMGKLNVAQFASELGLPVALLLEQLKAAGLAKEQQSDPMSEKDKAKLLEHLRQAHGAEKPAKKITLIRRETTEIKKADSSGRARTIQVEVRKRRVVAPAAAAEAAAPVEEAAAAPKKGKAAKVVDEQELAAREEEARLQAELAARQAAEAQAKQERSKRKTTKKAAEAEPQPVTPKRSEEHTSELQSPKDLVCRLLLEKKKPKPARYARLPPRGQHEPQSDSRSGR